MNQTPVFEIVGGVELLQAPSNPVENLIHNIFGQQHQPMSAAEAAAHDRAYYDAQEDAAPQVLEFNSVEDALEYLFGPR